MDRVMKISSNQSGAITASKNLIDFDIPAGMVYDLSKSYMVIHSSIETTDVAASATNTGGNGIANVGLDLKNPTPDRYFKNKHLIKNVSMFSQNVGMIENIKRSDVLQFNLDLYRDDIDTQVNASYNQVASLFGAQAQNGVKWSPHRRLTGIGTEPSDNLDREIRIGLKEVMNSCNNIWDGVKYGSTRIHAEVSVGNLVAVQQLKGNDTLWAATDGGVARGLILPHTDATKDNITITTSRTYTNPAEDSPFFVNQKIGFSAGTVGAAGSTTNLATLKRMIVGIKHIASGALELTFDTTLGTGVLASAALPAMVGVTLSDIDLNFDSAELVLYVTDKPPPPQIAFTTYKTEEDSFSGGGNNYNHQYYLDSDVQNIFWGSRATDDTLGFEQKVSTYRVREAGVDKTDRDITYGSALHTQRIIRAFGNSGMRIKNYTSGILNNGVRISHLIGDGTNPIKIPVNMIAETTAIGESPKLLDVNIVATGGFTLITLFKQVLKIM